VVVTLDDGYLDTLEQAKPMFAHFQIPATVFIATGYRGRHFWWDQLAQIFCTTMPLPAQWSISAEGDLLRGRREERNAQLPTAPRHRCRQLFSLYQQLLSFPFAKQQKVLETLQCWAQENRINPVRHTCRSLRPEEIVALNASDLVTIGAHTVTHPLLAALPAATQRFEITESKRYLEALLGQPIHYFSYPNGSSSPVTQALVREVGFHGACASFTDMAWRGSDRFHLPRIWAPNADGPTFRRWLMRWIHE
jgi:peptidoglycan/xylan/chitin deacetylase (PgdA/CDA1 family)